MLSPPREWSAHPRDPHGVRHNLDDARMTDDRRIADRTWNDPLSRRDIRTEKKDDRTEYGLPSSGHLPRLVFGDPEPIPFGFPFGVDAPLPLTAPLTAGCIPPGP